MTKPSNLRDAAEVTVTEADQSAAEAWLNANNGEWIDALNLAEAFARHRAAVEAENERLRLDVEAQEALQVSAYHAGLRAGWNFGVSDDNAGMQAALANTDHIKELRRIREARAALGEK